MKIDELHILRQQYLNNVKHFFLKLAQELKNNINFDVQIEEMKAEPDEILADFSIKVGKTDFMLDCSPSDPDFRLAVFKGTKLANKVIKKYKGEYDNVFENYVVLRTHHTSTIIKFFQELEVI